MEDLCPEIHAMLTAWTAAH